MQTGKKQDIKVNGKKLKLAVILPYFNEELGLELFENVKRELIRNNVLEKNINLTRVAGALEIPFACKKLAMIQPDAIIALGIVIRGETSHYDLVTETTHQGLMKVQLEEVVPIIFGVLACENLKQIKERISEKGLNKGKEFAQAALIQTLI